MAGTYTYAQQILVDCLTELHGIDLSQDDYNSSYIYAIEQDIQLALEHLYGKNSAEYRANCGLLTGPSGRVDIQQWRIDRAKRKIQQIIHGFYEQPSAEPEPEVVIKIIVNIFIDLENLRRSQAGESDMTEEEEDASRTYIREFLKNAFETVKTGGAAAQVISKYLPFFRTLFPELPPPPE